MQRKGITTVPEVLGVIHPYNLITIGRLYWFLFDWMLGTTDLVKAIGSGIIAYQYYKNVEVTHIRTVHKIFPVL